MRIYRYENATVYITEPQAHHIKNIRKATKIFLTRVLKEKVQNVNKNTSGNIEE